MPNATRPSHRFTDPSPYPILTQDADGATASSGTTRTDGTAGSPTRIASEAIRQVLGWRYRSEDVKGFQSALAKSFTARTDGDAITTYRWNRVAAATVDDAEITGALASFYTRTKVAIDQAVPLLDALRPLRPDADPEDTEVTRAIVRDRLLALPGTLAAPGGPPPQRVNTLFLLLLGASPESCHTNPESVGGELGLLRDRFGLDRREVNTIEEELNLTNFVIIVDYVVSLHQTWSSQSRFFNRGGKAEPFLGNQMVLIKNQLDVVADSVNRARAVMESVYFNVAEQQATFLHLGDGQSPMTVAELLDWVLDATQLAPDQMQSKDSVVAFRVVFEQLHALVAAALNQSRDNLNNSSRGFYTQRVQLAFDSLESSLAAALRLANQIHRGPRPVIATVTSLPGSREPNPGLRIAGNGFRTGAVVQVSPTESPEISLQSVKTVLTPVGRGQQLDATFKVSPTVGSANRKPDRIHHWSGAHDTLTIAVVNPDGQSDSTLLPVEATPATPSVTSTPSPPT